MPKEDGFSNLRPLSERSPEEAKEVRSKGGKARARKIREQRTFKELLALALSMKVQNKTGDVKTKKEVATILLADKCASGDLKAIALAQSMLGEEATKKLEVTGKDGKDLMPARVLTPEEAAAMMASMDNEYR